jgi:glycosyltransferase involved in cell wall biosynthesis
MKISIVTPSFNQGQFIADAIESVANQDYPDKEHIIIDAQSTDKTIEVIKSYEHLPHLKWVSEPDEGQADAINKGFKMASGDVVAWLNADDYYLADTFSKVADVFERNPQVNIVYSDTMLVDKNKKLLRIKKITRLMMVYCFIMAATYNPQQHFLVNA